MSVRLNRLIRQGLMALGIIAAAAPSIWAGTSLALSHKQLSSNQVHARLSVHGTSLHRVPMHVKSKPTAASHANAPISSQSNTVVSVNGTTIPIPANGSVHQTVTQDGSVTQVDVAASNQSIATPGTTHNHSSMSVTVHSDSHQSVHTITNSFR